MANELRVRTGFLGGLIEDNPLASGATTLTSAALASVPAIGSTQHMAITLDPDGLDGAPEIAYITAHTAAAQTATITKGQEGSVARAHLRDIPWVHGPTVRDFDGPWRVTIIPSVDTTSATVGTWAPVTHTDATYIFAGAGWQNSSSAQNDSISWDNVHLAPGTWDLTIHHRKSTNTAIITVNIDGSSVGTVDTYAAAVARGAGLISAFTITTGHLHTVQLLNATKNGSSSAYNTTLHALHFRRTA
jgi:hypothetical protein